METPATYALSLATTLTLKTMEPLHLAKGAGASKLLSRVEWFEIAGIDKMGDTVFYVVDVYLAKEQSRLAVGTSSPRGGFCKPTRTEPDYRVRRRFSEFSTLFADLLVVIQYSHKHYCHLCNEFRSLLVFSSMRPLVGTRGVVVSTAIRRQVLTKLLRRVVDQFQRTKPLVSRRGACCASHEIPLMLQEFFFGKEDVAPQQGV